MDSYFFPALSSLLSEKLRILSSAVDFDGLID